VKHITFAEGIQIVIVFESKLFQIASSNNLRKFKFLLSVSSRPKEYWPHIQRPHVSRHDKKTVQKTLQTRVVEATQFCCDW